MKLAIMQPYFLPYIGYWQLLHSVDKFVIYDNIKYTKKGWINRNRILKGLGDTYITIPIEKDSDFLNVNERIVAKSFDIGKLVNQVSELYRKAPNYNKGLELLREILHFDEKNLFNFILNSIVLIKDYLGIDTEIIVSSTLDVDHSLRGRDKVISICKYFNTNMYINPIGGIELYDKNDFYIEGIELKFIKSDEIQYQQNGNPFVPWLSILDTIMFVEKPTLSKILNQYKLV